MNRRPGSAHLRCRRGYSLLEAGIVVGLVALVGLWALPRLTADTTVSADHTAQAHVDLALEAALAVRRDLGRFDADPALLEVYTLDVAVQPADTATLTPGQVSVGVDGPGSLATVTAAAVADDGVCWMTRRAFGTADFDVIYAYATSGTCNADAAALLSPAAGRGQSWSRPLDAGA